MKKTTEPESAFKNWIDVSLLKTMATSLTSVHPKFDSKALMQCQYDFPKLELKGRVQCVTKRLHELLPSEYPKALDLLMRSVRQGQLSGFALWPYSQFIQTYGREDFDLSFEAMKEMTKLFSSEFAIRPFLKADPKRGLKKMLALTKSKDEHLRRWASEGSRPRLPWGERIHFFINEPESTLAILTALRFDESLYVRKSVSNHLNDISKDHPELVIKVLREWHQTTPVKHQAKIDWITRQALRGLIKQGHSSALQLVGVDSQAKIKMHSFKLDRAKLKLGQKITLEVWIESSATKSQKLIVDYVVHHVKSNGQTSPKVFKWKVIDLGAKEKLGLMKNHSVKPITTRAYYEGRHQVEVMINGQILGKTFFDLTL